MESIDFTENKYEWGFVLPISARFQVGYLFSLSLFPEKFYHSEVQTWRILQNLCKLQSDSGNFSIRFLRQYVQLCAWIFAFVVPIVNFR